MPMALLRSVILLGAAARAAHTAATGNFTTEPECVKASVEDAFGCVAMCQEQSGSMVESCLQSCETYFMMIPHECSGYMDCVSGSLPTEGSVGQGAVLETVAMCFGEGPMGNKTMGNNTDEGVEPECMKASLEDAFGCVAMCREQSSSMVESCLQNCETYFMMIPHECSGYMDCVSGSLPTEGRISQGTVLETVAMCFGEGPMENKTVGNNTHEEVEPECMKDSLEAALDCMAMYCEGWNISTIDSCMETCSYYFMMIPPQCAGYMDCMQASFPMEGIITQGLLNETLGMCWENGPMDDDDDYEDEEPECMKDSLEGFFGCWVSCQGENISMVQSCLEGCNSLLETIPECTPHVNCVAMALPSGSTISQGIVAEAVAMCLEGGPVDDDDDDEEEEEDKPECVKASLEEGLDCVVMRCGGENLSMVEGCLEDCSGYFMMIPECESQVACLASSLPVEGIITKSLFNETVNMCLEKGPMEDDDEEEQPECMKSSLEAVLGCIASECQGQNMSFMDSCVETCSYHFMTVPPECQGYVHCMGASFPMEGIITRGLINETLAMCLEQGPMEDDGDDDDEEEDDDDEEGEPDCLGAGFEAAYGCLFTECIGKDMSMVENCAENCSNHYFNETWVMCFEEGPLLDDDAGEDEPECMKSAYERVFGCVIMDCGGQMMSSQNMSMMESCSENCSRHFLGESFAMCLGDWPMEDDDDDDEEEESDCMSAGFELAFGCMFTECAGVNMGMVESCAENCSNHYFNQSWAMCFGEGPMEDDDDGGEEPECMKAAYNAVFGCVVMDCGGQMMSSQNTSMMESCSENCSRHFLNESFAMCLGDWPMGDDDDDDEEEESDCMSAGFELAFGCMFTECAGVNMGMVESCAENCSNHYFNQSWAMCFGEGPMEDDDDGAEEPECMKAAYNAVFGCVVMDCGGQMMSSQNTSMMESCSENCSRHFFNESFAMCGGGWPMEDDDDEEVRCTPEMVQAPFSCVLAKCSGEDTMMLGTCMEWCHDDFDMLPASCDLPGDCFQEYMYSQPYGTSITDQIFMAAVEMCFPCWKAGSHVMIVPGSQYIWQTDSCAFLDKDICMGKGRSKVVFENGIMEEYEFEDLQLCERANFSSSAKTELLFEAVGDSQMYDFSWPGWSNKGYFNTTADDGTPGIPAMSGKFEAYDSMCLAGLRLKDASGAFAEYELTPGFTGFSLVQIVQNCSMSTMFRRLDHDPGYSMPDMDMCSMVGKLKMSNDLPYVSEYLQVHAYTATGAAMFLPVWDGPWALGTSSTNVAFAGTVSIEGVPALDLLFSAYGGSWDFNNQWPGWFQEGPYSIPSHGKLPAFDHKPLTMLRFADDKGRFAEYSLNTPYSGMSLLEIVQECMPANKRERRNNGSPAWHSGHCSDVGILTASKGLDKVSQVLRIGVGDGTFDQNWRDWVVFMPVEGHGDGDFLRANTWAFGSKGETNTGNNDGPVYIYGGPSTGCVEKEEKCWPSGTRVMIVPGSRNWHDTYRCAYLQVDVCEWDDDWTWVTFDDGFSSLYAYDDLQPCQALPGSTTFEELMFNASGWDWTFNNQYEGWFSWPEDGMPSKMSTSVNNGGYMAEYDSQGFVSDYYKTMCLSSVKFADKSGTFAMYKLGDDYLGKSLLQIVQECMHEGKANRRNDGTRRWNEGHCLDVGYLQDFAGRDDFSNLRIGVGDGKVGDMRDWTVFMPIKGNGNGDFLWPRGEAWSFGSKGRTNPAFEDEVYIYGYPDVVKLVGYDKCDLKNTWSGWYESGSYGSDESYGKQLAYDELPLQIIRFQDDDGNFAEYDLEYTQFDGMTLLEIVQYCMPMTPEERSNDGGYSWSYGWCEVGALRRFGGPALVSVPRSFRIGVAFGEAFSSDRPDDWSLFVLQYPASGVSSLTAEEVWAFGTNCETGGGPAPKMSIWGYSGFCDKPEGDADPSPMPDIQP